MNKDYEKLALQDQAQHFKKIIGELEAHYQITFSKEAKQYLRKMWSFWGEGKLFYIGEKRFGEICKNGVATSDFALPFAWVTMPKSRLTGICTNRKHKGKTWLLENNIIQPHKVQIISGRITQYAFVNPPAGWMVPKSAEEENKEASQAIAQIATNVQNGMVQTFGWSWKK